SEHPKRRRPPHFSPIKKKERRLIHPVRATIPEPPHRDQRPTGRLAPPHRPCPGSRSRSFASCRCPCTGSDALVTRLPPLGGETCARRWSSQRVAPATPRSPDTGGVFWTVAA